MNEGKKKRSSMLGAKEERILLMKAQEAFRKADNNEEVPRDLLKAAQTLIYRVRSLVKYLAYGYSFFSDSTQEEKVSAGNEIIPKAIRKFDFKFKGRFVTYLGHWVKQAFQGLSKKNSIISRSTTGRDKDKRNVIFYDNVVDDNTNRETYTLVDTLYDSHELSELEKKDKERDISRVINELLMKLNDSFKILLLRLSYNIPPYSLFDIYNIMSENEKLKFRRAVKRFHKNIILNDLKNIEIFNSDLKNNKIVKKYLSLFSSGKKWKFPELASYFGEKESYLRRERKNILNYLNKKSKEEGKNLEIFI